MRALAFAAGLLMATAAYADVYSLTDAQGNVNCILWDGSGGYAPPTGSAISAKPVPDCRPVSHLPAETVLSRSAFLGRFTQAELVAISAASRANDAINVWLMTAQAADRIDLTAAATKSGLDALVAGGVITADRAAKILTP